MPVYHRQGKIPAKRHVVFRKTDGTLYHEELFGTEGFSGVSSLVYHLYPPTFVKDTAPSINIRPEIALEDNLKALSFQGFEVPPTNDYIESRVALFVNDDMHIGLAAPKQGTHNYFFKNADADELIFIHKGDGKLSTNYGSIEFGYGDYLVIPRGTVYKIDFKSEDNRLLIIESFSPVETPQRYRNVYGQMLEHAPFCDVISGYRSTWKPMMSRVTF